MMVSDIRRPRGFQAGPPEWSPRTSGVYSTLGRPWPWLEPPARDSPSRNRVAGRGAGATPPCRESIPKKLHPAELIPPQGGHLAVWQTRFHLHATNSVGAQTRGALYRGLLVLIFSLRGVSRNAASTRRLPDRVPDNTWQPTKSRWKVYSQCQLLDIGYLDNAARPHKVHA
jgi:hypothetical protein